MNTKVMRRDILEQEYVRPEAKTISAVCESYFLNISTSVTVEEEVTEDEYEIIL